MRFAYCNLSERSIFLLAEALEKNTTLRGFSCFQNPCNFPDGRTYDPNTPCEKRVKQALIATTAPIEIWNNYPLPSDLIEDRRKEEEDRRKAEDKLRQFENEHAVIFELLNRASISDRILQHNYAKVFVEKGLDRLDRLLKVNADKLESMGVKLGDAIDIVETAKHMSGDGFSKSLPAALSTTKKMGAPGHLLFFSYAQKDCAGETLQLAQHASVKFPGHSIFRDADVKFKLSELVQHVKQSKNVIVVLSENYPRRPFTLVELHTALQVKANVVAVRATRQGLNQFDFGQVQKDIANGNIYNYLDESGWALLREYDIDLEAVATDLKAVMNVAAGSLDLLAAQTVIHAMLDHILHGVVL